MSSRKRIVLIVAAILGLILLFVAGYTFSKYFQSINGKATADIAAWSFKANAGNENANLSEIKLTTADGGKIAPGTNGEFKIKVDSIGSDVDVDYKVDISQEKLPANMNFKLKGETQTYSTMADLAQAKLKGTLDTSNNQVKTYTIVWDWPMVSYDANNLALNDNDMSALALAPDLGFKIEVTGEQKGN